SAAPFGDRIEFRRRARAGAAGAGRIEAGRRLRAALSESSRGMIDDLERAIEAMLFASDEPLDARQVAGRLGDEMTPGQVKAIIETIAQRHAGSGIELVERG